MTNRTITLLIKKKYFDLIKIGEKKKEYRSYKPYYQKIFNNEVKFIKLHYQGDEELLVEVEKIELISTPSEIKNIKNILFTEKVFEISLGKVFHNIKSRIIWEKEEKAQT